MALVASALTILSIHSTSAYELSAERWDHACFTHDGSPQVKAALATWGAWGGVTDCGVSATPDISIGVLTKEWEADLGRLWANAEAVYRRENVAPYTHRIACVIYVRPAFAHDEWTILHEVGHCLGLEHSTAPAVMNANWIDRAPVLSPDDRVAIQAIYGPRVAPLGWKAYGSVAR